MAILTTNQDIVSDVVFFGNNTTLNAGDRLTGTGADDTFFYAADDTLNNLFGRTFAAFQLIGVENFDVTNDSLGFVNFDLSSSTGLVNLSVSNSSEDVRFEQVTNMVNLALNNTTDAATVDVTLQYQDAVVAGANDAMTLTVNGTNANVIRIGRVGDSDNGIETVNLITVGNSVINQLDTNLTTLNVNGGGNVAIVNALDTTVRNINSTGSGNVDLSWVNNTVGVTYVGSSTGTGVNDLLAGSGNDNITTFAGNDIINAGAGDDTVNAGEGNNTVFTGAGVNSVTTGSGNDVIIAQGTVDTISSGLGNDVINITAGGRADISAGDGSDLVNAGGNFNAAPGAGNDEIDFGANYDALRVNAGLADVNFTNVTNLEAVVIQTAGTTTLGGGAGPNNRAQLAGIESVFLVSNGSDTVDASTYTESLVVYSFGNDFNTAGVGTDVITTGSATDIFLFRGDGNLDNSDVLNAGAGFDLLTLNGDTTITGGGFSNFELIELESNRFGDFPQTSGGNTYNLTLTDANAPSAGASLTINGLALQGDTDGIGGFTSEDVFVDTTAVTAFATSINTGGGNDRVRSGSQADFMSLGAGDDAVVAGAGNDVIDLGTGNNSAILSSGDNTVFGGNGQNLIYLGTGNDTVFVGSGDDFVWSAPGSGAANAAGLDAIGDLNSLDTLVDGGGRDTIFLGGRNHVDADFTNVSGFEILDMMDARTLAVGAQAQEAGVDTVIGSFGNDVIDAQSFTSGLTVDLSRGGNDFAITGSGDDVFIAGTGDQFVNGQAGDDRLRINGNEWNLADGFAGGAGADTVVLDNTLGAVTAGVNLSLVTSVENYTFLTGGNRTAGTDADNNVLTFANAISTTVTTLTTINVNAASLTDTDDTLNVVLDASLGDADFAFNITGSATQTIVTKSNFGVNNNINFQGGAGADTLIISGGDLGGTTIFNGGAGTDVIIQVAGGLGAGQGLLSDDSFVGVTNVEILAASTGALNAVLGASASASGLQLVNGNTGNDSVVLSAAFTTPLIFILGNGGDDTFNGAASSAALTFVAVDGELNAVDTISGGSSAADVMFITATGGTSDATTVTGVETIFYAGDGDALAANGSTLLIDTTIADVNGGTQTINAGALDGLDVFTLNGGAATANLVVTGGGAADVITTGSGNDTINGGAGNDLITALAGDDTVNGGSGNDVIYGNQGADTLNGGDGDDIISGGQDNDTVNGDAGNDFLRGDLGNDTINGGSGNDQISGGQGADIMDGGSGADIFFYNQRTDSSIIEGKDTINNFESGVDKVDARGVAEAVAEYGAGAAINFAGNFATFGDAQSAITAGDGIFDVVYQQDTNTLWFDLNDDGTLNGDDLQITVNTTGASDTLTAADIYGGSVIDAAPLGTFNALF